MNRSTVKNIIIASVECAAVSGKGKGKAKERRGPASERSKRDGELHVWHYTYIHMYGNVGAPTFKLLLHTKTKSRN